MPAFLMAFLLLLGLAGCQHLLVVLAQDLLHVQAGPVAHLQVVPVEHLAHQAALGEATVDQGEESPPNVGFHIH